MTTPNERLASLAALLTDTATVPYGQVSTHTHAAMARNFAASIGNGILTSVAVTHGLGTLDVAVQCFENSTGLTITPATVTRTDINTVTLTFALAPTSNAYRVLVTG